MSNNKPIKYNHTFSYDQAVTEYTCKVKKRFPWQWLLLLLLLPLLLIKCEKDVTVTVVDIAGNPIENANVTLSYNLHYAYDNGEFFTNDYVTKAQTTDDDGKTVFKNLKCSVYSYIFYAFSDMVIEVETADNYSTNDVVKNFHYTNNVLITLTPVLKFQTVSLGDNQPLPHCNLVIEIDGKSYEPDDSGPTGEFIVKDLPKTGKISILARHNDYESNDYTVNNIDINELIGKVTPIPLAKNCSAGNQIDDVSDEIYSEKTFSMGQNSGEFRLQIKTYCQPDRFVVKNERGEILFDTGYICSKQNGEGWDEFVVAFDTRLITICVDKDFNQPETSRWHCIPHCPE